MQASWPIVAGTSLAMGIACVAMLGAMVLLGDSTVLQEGHAVSPGRSPAPRTMVAPEMPSPVVRVPAQRAVLRRTEAITAPASVAIRRSAPAQALPTALPGNDVVERALDRLPAAVQHSLRAARVRVVLCDEPPTGHPFNGDVRDLPRYRGRNEFYRRFGNIAFVDSSRGRRALDRSMLVVLGEAFDSWAGDVSAQPEFEAALARGAIHDTPLTAQLRRDRFAAWFAGTYGSDLGEPTSEPVATAAGDYFRDLEHELELFESWMVRTGAAFSGSRPIPIDRPRATYSARLRWLVATQRPRPQTPRTEPSAR